MIFGQACAFRDSYEKFKKAGAEVVGISGDDSSSHKVIQKLYLYRIVLTREESCLPFSDTSNTNYNETSTACIKVCFFSPFGIRKPCIKFTNIHKSRMVALYFLII